MWAWIGFTRTWADQLLSPHIGIPSKTINGQSRILRSFVIREATSIYLPIRPFRNFRLNTTSLSAVTGFAKALSVKIEFPERAK